MSTIDGPYKASNAGTDANGFDRHVVAHGDREICRTSDNDLQTAEIIASALNLWELGSDDDTLDQLTAAHQMNLALSKRVQELTATIETFKNRVPTDGEDYGDNLVGTADAMLKKGGKAGSYDLATFDSARLSNVKTQRARVSRSGEDVVTIASTIELRKRCIRSGEYSKDDKPIGGHSGSGLGGFFGGGRHG